MVVSQKHIRDFCGKQAKRMLTREKHLYKSKKVVTITYDTEYPMLTRRVEASMRNLTYKVWINLRRTNDVAAAGCDCVRGLSKCGHMVELLYQAMQCVSSTSDSCQWSKKKKLEDDMAVTVDALQNRKTLRPTYGDLDPILLEELELDLKLCPDSVGAGALFLLAKEPDKPPLTAHTAPDAGKIICTEGTIDENELQRLIPQKLAISWTDIVQVADATTGQSKNPAWTFVRHCRTTASNCGPILKKMKTAGEPNVTEAFLPSLLVHRNLDRVKSIQWGRTHEKVALAKFQKDSKMSVTATGIWLHDSGALGASPDGLIGDNAVIEVKCPYTVRQAAKLSEAFCVDNNANKANSNRKNSKNSNSKKKEKKMKETDLVVYYKDGKWYVNPEHDYYHQIQAALYFTKRERGIFYVWIPNDFVLMFVTKDPAWKMNIPILLSFYFKFFVPFVRAQNIPLGG